MAAGAMGLPTVSNAGNKRIQNSMATCKHMPAVCSAFRLRPRHVLQSFMHRQSHRHQLSRGVPPQMGFYGIQVPTINACAPRAPCNGLKGSCKCFRSNLVPPPARLSQTSGNRTSNLKRQASKHQKMRNLRSPVLGLGRQAVPNH